MSSRIQVSRSLADIRSLQDDLLAAGESSIPRNEIASSATLSSGNMRLTFFMPRRSEPITSVRTSTSGTAAGATPTLCRIGIFEADQDSASATFTLVASIVNDTTLWAATNTRYTRALSSTWNKRAGVRCAVGLLCVTAAAAPTISGSAVPTGSGAEMLEWPWTGATETGLSDLPASFVLADLPAASAGTSRPYVAFVP